MTNQLTFIHLPVDLRALYRLAARRGWSGAHHFDEGRALHHALGEVFGPGALQPFRLMVPPRQREAGIYAYSSHSFAELEQQMQIAPPESGEVFHYPALRHKSLAIQFKPGHRLGFDIRARPICRIKSPDKKRGREMDIYQRKAELHGDEPGWHEKHNRETVYLQWLSERFRGGAQIEPGACLKRFRRIKTGRGKHVSEGPDAIMQGTLEVTDAARFADLLVRGAGRHKSYGYGMILLRPAGRPALRG